MSILFLDFETKSACDIKKCGADVYSKDPTTDILCIGYAFDDGPASIILPCLLTTAILNHIRMGGEVVAHNAAFEYAIWNNVGVHRYAFPKLSIDQLQCTMAMSYAMALPGSLDNATAAMGIAEGKDKAGRRVMMQLSSPKKISDDGKIEWHEATREKLDLLYEYCKKDVELERELYHRLLALSPEEQAMWRIDQVINNRGVRVDTRAVKIAMGIAELEKKRLDEKMRAITWNAVATCNAHSQLAQWVRESGVPIEGVGKPVLNEVLSREGLPPAVKEALECRREAGKSSVAKLPAMLLGAGPDERIRGMFQFCGAGRTGRWAGRKVQLHNLPRPSLEKEAIEHVFTLLSTASNLGLKNIIEQLQIFYGSPLSVLSDCLRGFLVPAEGFVFLAADFEQIEARVLAWLAGAEDVLELFRTTGKLYEYTATQIYHGVTMDTVDKEQRQVGKVAALALGFGGGNKAFMAMAGNYGVTISEYDAFNIVTRWREKNKSIVRYWRALENAAFSAVKWPGQAFSAGADGRKITYKKQGSFLWCRLPSGRVLCYPYPEIEKRRNQWREERQDVLSYMGEDENRKWVRERTWGGKLVENCTQAVASDLLREAIMRCERARYPVVLHVHDEIVCEVPTDGCGSVDELENLVSEAPVWAYGLPIGAKGWRGNRYQK